MRQRLRFRRPSHATVIAYLALFVALATGGAYASHLVVNSSDVVNNSLLSEDIKGTAGTATAAAVNGTLTGADVSGQPAKRRPPQPFVDGSLTTSDIKNNSLTGSDVNESSLGQVPSALLGGFGRQISGQRCNPEEPPGDDFPCAVVTLNLPARARLLLIGRATAFREAGATSGDGSCVLASTGGTFLNTRAVVSVATSAETENVSLVTVTDPFPAGGPHSFGINCNESAGGIQFISAGITVIAISPN